MKTSNWMKRFAAIAGSALMGLMIATGANALNPEPVVAEVTFVAAIAITEDNPLQFGLIDVALNTETIIIATNDVVTGTGTALVLGPAPQAADLTIDATSGVTINILIDNVSTGTGYGLSTWLCDYQGGSITACDGVGKNVTSVASGALRVGVTLTGDNTAVAGNQDGSFDVTVAYQ